MLKSFFLLFFRLKFALGIHQFNIKFGGTLNDLGSNTSTQIMGDFSGEGSIVH